MVVGLAVIGCPTNALGTAVLLREQIAQVLPVFAHEAWMANRASSHRVGYLKYCTRLVCLHTSNCGVDHE